jgi:hypothetical protein
MLTAFAFGITITALRGNQITFAFRITITAVAFGREPIAFGRESIAFG